jgi:hypothetical protein
MIIIMHIYNWYHSITTGIHYIHEHRFDVHGTFPLLYYLPLLSSVPFCSHLYPLYLLGTLLAVTGSVHLVPRLLVN